MEAVKDRSQILVKHLQAKMEFFDEMPNLEKELLISFLTDFAKEQDKITKDAITININEKIAVGEMIPAAYAINIVSEAKSI